MTITEASNHELHEDWKFEVANNDTSLGFSHWLAAREGEAIDLEGVVAELDIIGDDFRQFIEDYMERVDGEDEASFQDRAYEEFMVKYSLAEAEERGYHLYRSFLAEIISMIGGPALAEAASEKANATAI